MRHRALPVVGGCTRHASTLNTSKTRGWDYLNDILNSTLFSPPRPLTTSPLLLTRLFLLTRLYQPGVANVATIPARERPILNDPGVHHHLDVHIEEGHDLEILELIVADLAQ